MWLQSASAADVCGHGRTIDATAEKIVRLRASRMNAAPLTATLPPENPLRGQPSLGRPQRTFVDFDLGFAVPSTHINQSWGIAFRLHQLLAMQFFVL
jgi:hypothetical protein